MIVVDVNTLAYLWIPGEFTQAAELAHETDPDWFAPLLWRSEFQNILAGYLRRRMLDRKTVDACLGGAEMQMTGKEYRVPSNKVLDEVEESTCSAYDCEYVALARDLQVPLVTSDQKILTSFPDIAVSLEQFAG